MNTTDPLDLGSIEAVLIGSTWISVEPGSVHLVTSAWADGENVLSRTTIDRHSVRFQPVGEKFQIDVVWAEVVAVRHHA